MKKIILLLLLIPGLLLAVANYVYHGPTETSDNPSGHEYRTGVVNSENSIYANEAATIAVKVEYNGWVNSVNIAYTTDGSTPEVTDNATALDWWENGTSDGTGVPQVWGKASVIPQQSVGTTVKYILWAKHDGGDWIFANGGDDGNHNEATEATVFSYTVLDDSSLPVELSAFSAHSSSKGVKLTWTTDSEIENHGFTIMRKSDAKDWAEIASFTKCPALEGQGSTTEATDYYFIDTQVKDGWSYSYQLTDVDYQGKQTFHKDHIQSITYVNPGKSAKPDALKVLKLYPNPFNPTVTLTYDLAAMSDLYVSIYNLAGEQVWNHAKGSHPAGQNYTLTWNGNDLTNSPLPSGIYLVNIQAGTQIKSEKVTLLR